MDDLTLNSKSSTSVGIRTGKQYLEGLKDNREVWMHGKRIKDVTKQNGIKKHVQSVRNIIVVLKN